MAHKRHEEEELMEMQDQFQPSASQERPPKPQVEERREEALRRITPCACPNEERMRRVPGVHTSRGQILREVYNTRLL